MLRHNFLNVLWLFPLTLTLTGCASTFFPDFDEGSDIVVDDGGKVEIHKIEERGILISDKANALYEGEEDENNTQLASENNAQLASAEETNAEVARRLSQLPKSEDEEQIVPAKVTTVTKSDELPEIKSSDSQVAPSNEDIPASSSMHYLAGVVYFANGGAYIDNDARNILRQVAAQAKEHHAQVEVYGFASSRTRNTDPISHKLANFNISAERANNVAAALISLGIKKDLISVQALSDSMPMYQEVMPEGERLNRRAEIYLTY